MTCTIKYSTNQLRLSMNQLNKYYIFLLDKPIHDNILIFNTQHLAKGEHIARDVLRNLKKIGIAPERFHAEFGPGQYEISSVPVFGIRSADNAFRLKQVVKEVARKFGHKAIWLTKPFKDCSGSSAHFNHSLWNSDG